MIEIIYDLKSAKNAGLKDEGDFAIRKIERIISEEGVPESDLKKVVIKPIFVNGQKRIAVIIEFNKDSKTWQTTKEYIEMFFASRSLRIDVIDIDEIENGRS